MLHVVLYQPEIPPNTGNVIRLCANAGAALHLVRPLGFGLDHAKLRRAGLDYREFARIAVHEDFDGFLEAARPTRWFACSAHANQRYDHVRYADGDAFVFGPETRGLPEDLLRRVPGVQRIRLPMRPGNRSLNLSNAVAVTVFEAWHLLGFVGSA
jgi:tRNA (cytidine/uridine-2'-O-)-methyltransferase